MKFHSRNIQLVCSFYKPLWFFSATFFWPEIKFHVLYLYTSILEVATLTVLTLIYGTF